MSSSTTSRTNFELFHVLSERVNQQTSSPGQATVPHDWPTLCREILNLGQEHMELILALILSYASTEKKTKSASATSTLVSSAKLPYKSKTFAGSIGFVVDIENLPAKLQDIVALYVKTVLNVRA